MKSAETIAQYIAAEPPPVRKELKQLYAILKRGVPKATTEKLAWGMPTLVLEGNLLHFAAFKNHQSLFAGTDMVVAFKKDLARQGLGTTKAAIHFPYGQKLPAALITRIAKACVKRNLAAAKAKPAKAKAAKANAAKKKRTRKARAS